MSDQRVLELQKGIWIKEEWLRKAGLGSRFQVVVKPGEIRILSATIGTERHAPSEKGWDILRALGRDAQSGALRNAAEEHDRYLYGKGR